MKEQYLTKINCKECCEMCEDKTNVHAICCYDGVYLKEGEEEKLRSFVHDNRAYFNNIPDEFITFENWRDKVKGKKIVVREYIHKHALFPKHFNNTICVFNDIDGKCQIQKACELLGKNPWDIKPESCVLFPLRSISNEIYPPPNRDEIDPCYIDESYPSFYKSLPCCKEDENGLPWRELYKKEIEYYTEKVIKDRITVRQEGDFINNIRKY